MQPKKKLTSAILTLLLLSTSATAMVGCGNTQTSKAQTSKSTTAQGKVLAMGTPSQAGLNQSDLQDIDKAIQQGMDAKAFPGAVVLIAHDGVVGKETAYGYSALYKDAQFDKLASPVKMQTNTIFDLASLTKLFTTVAALTLVDQGKLDLDAPVAKYIPQFGQNGKADITIRMLMTHTSGLQPDIKFWKIKGSVAQRLDALYKVKPTVKPGTKFIYSDLNMITLAEVVQKLSGESLDVYIKQHITQPLGMTDTMFNPPKSLKQRIAATEVQSWTNRGLIWGAVDDENSWALGGVAGHAGLFSTAHDLGIFCQMILDGGIYDGHRILNTSTVTEMEKDQLTPGGPHGLGFELDESWYMGDLASGATIGHTGFTGTSIVVDTQQHIICILLTNRLNPTRNGPSTNPYRVKVANDAELAYLMGNS